MNNNQCDLKKITIWLKGLLYSLLLFIGATINAQELSSQYFHNNPGAEVSISPQHNVSKILNQSGIVLDHGSTASNVNLYINEEGFEYLNQKSIEFIWRKPQKSNIKMKGPKDIFHVQKGTCMPAMDFYPTYQAYEQMMYAFESMYPSICKIHVIGTLQSGRQILVAQIGDNLDQSEDEPNFMYTSTMHGDELAGYPTMLMFIDNLLCSYGSDEHITELVNNINIYINPLANPNGVYRGGDDTVEDGTRFNASFVDLNRNFPDPEDGDHPDGHSYQEETLIFMDFAQKNKINLACNIHSGVELINYPWDTYVERHADDNWCYRVCREYADTVQLRSPQGYFTAQDNGVTNGYDWYEIQGGRQDYTTFFQRSREVTLEISNQKKLDADRLPEIWSFHKKALLNYMEESLFGLRGTIVDCKTQLPIEAEVTILDHDKLNSSVFSDSINGSYFRYLENGLFDAQFTAVGYDTLVEQIVIVDKASTRLDIEMCETSVSTTSPKIFLGTTVTQQDDLLVFENVPLVGETSVKILNTDGKMLLEQNIESNNIQLPSDLNSNIYIVLLTHENQTQFYKLFLRNN